MCLAPMRGIPPSSDMDGLGIGIELDIFGIGDEGWPLAAEGCPEEQAAAKSAGTPTSTAPRKTAW